MEGANENRGLLKPVNLREMGNRRALKDIKNLAGAPPHPCAVTKKNVLAEKSQNCATRRPMTRKFAASLANKSRPCHEEASDKRGLVGNQKHKKLPSISSLPSDLEKSDAIDVDVDLPMVEESEEMEDCEHVKEVVMEEIVVESAVDIDSCDLGNPLAVVDYVEDIYNYYKRIELELLSHFIIELSSECLSSNLAQCSLKEFRSWMKKPVNSTLASASFFLSL